MDGRSIQDFIFRFGARKRIRLEHGRRRAAGVFVVATEHALGLLQAAFCAGDESADRSAARNARDVSRSEPAAGNYAGDSDFDASRAGGIARSLQPRASRTIFISLQTRSPGCAPRCRSVDYPSEW